MSSSNIHGMVKVTDLENVEKMLEQLRKNKISLDTSNLQSHIFSEIEAIFFVIKTHFILIKSKLEPEVFSICLYFFKWFSGEFDRLRSILKSHYSQENTKDFLNITNNLILQLARFIGFLEKIDLGFQN